MRINHQINHLKNNHIENEAGTDQETVTRLSMPVSGMDEMTGQMQLSGKDHRRKKTENASSASRAFSRAAHAAAAGILAVASGGFSLTAAAGKISAQDPAAFLSKDRQEKTEMSSADGWEEEEILRRWDLDPDSFPPEEEEELPEIREELLPYFSQAVLQAVDSYAGEVPPEPDLEKFTPRADAIRKAVRTAARTDMQAKTDSVMGILRSNIQNAGEKDIPAFLYALQDYPSWLRVNGDFSQMFSFHQKKQGQHTGTKDAEETSSGDPSEPSGAASEKEGAGASKASSPESSDSIRKFLKDAYSAPAKGEESSGQPDNSMPSGEEGAGPSEGNYNGNYFQLLSETPEQENPLDPLMPAQLYVFSIQFPSDRYAETTLQGAPLFPGLSNYIGFEPVTDFTPPSSGFSSEPVMEVSTGTVIKSDSEPVSENLSGPEQGSLPEPVTEIPAEAALPEKDTASTVVSAETAVAMLPLADHSAEGEDGHENEKQRRIVFIGDSRTVGMEIYCGGAQEEYWIAKNSMGYSWMADSAVPGAEPLIEDGTDVVILMGVNDLGNVGRYVDLMNRKAAEWKKRGARTFFVSVTPVDDRRSPNAKNARIEAFNAYAQENLEGVIYIDAYSRIRNSFGTPDGIHFSAATYRDIYRIIHFSLYRGWYEEAGLWFYFDRGKPLTGWQYLDGSWQYMDGLGVRWVRNGRIGDAYLAPYPRTGILDPYEGAWRPE